MTLSVMFPVMPDRTRTWSASPAEWSQAPPTDSNRHRCTARVTNSPSGSGSSGR
jgi:hypothetical protein